MREIKFRAWHTKGKWMDSAWLIDWEHGKVCHSKHNQSDLEDCILMQYTGLKDKNGKEIYEGDIIRFIFDDDDSPGSSTYAEIYLVEWNGRNLQFEFSDNKYHPMGMHQGKHTIWSMSHMSYEIEAIGNIYENPELVEKGAEG